MNDTGGTFKRLNSLLSFVSLICIISVPTKVYPFILYNLPNAFSSGNIVWQELQGKFVCRAKLGIAQLSFENIISIAIIMPHIIFLLNLQFIITCFLYLDFFPSSRK